MGLLRSTFPKDVIEAAYKAQHGRCWICEKAIQDFHHRIANTKTNSKLFPVLIHSIFNCVGLCRGCHTNWSHQVSITHDIAVAWEEDLRER